MCISSTKRVPTSITRALLRYHADKQWLAALQLCSFMTEQRIRLCPEHLFIAADTIGAHRPDLSDDFARTFCTAEQQPSLVGLGRARPGGDAGSMVSLSVRPSDYICENMSFIAAHNHHGDGMRLIRNCNAYPEVTRLLGKRVSALWYEGDRESFIGGCGALDDGMAMLADACVFQIGRAHGDAALLGAAVDGFCHLLAFVDGLTMGGVREVVDRGSPTTSPTATFSFERAARSFDLARGSLESVIRRDASNAGALQPDVQTVRAVAQFIQALPACEGEGEGSGRGGRMASPRLAALLIDVLRVGLSLQPSSSAFDPALGLLSPSQVGALQHALTAGSSVASQDAGLSR